MNFRDKLLLWAIGLFLLGSFTFMVSSILLPFIVAMIAAYFLNPAVNKLEKLHLSRSLATLLMIAVFFAVAVSAIVFIVPVLYGQFVDMTTKIPEYISAANQSLLPSVNSAIEKFAPDLMLKAKESAGTVSVYLLQFAANIVQNLWNSGMALVNLLSLAFVMPVVTFYIMRDWPLILKKITSIIPKKYAPVILGQMHEIDIILSAYIRGQTNVCLLLGAFYAVGLMLVGLDFGFLIGMLTGILAFIPYVGLLFGFALAIIVAIFQFGDVLHIAIVAGIFIIGQFIEGNFVTPKLVGDKVGLHPVWIIFGMMAGAAMFGFIGILIAVPVTAIIGVIMRFAIKEYMKSSLYLGNKKTAAGA